MQRFESPDQARRFLSSHAMIYGHFRPRRHLMSAARYRRARAEAFRVWRQGTCVQTAVWSSEPYCGGMAHGSQPAKLTMPRALTDPDQALAELDTRADPGPAPRDVAQVINGS